MLAQVHHRQTGGEDVVVDDQRSVSISGRQD